MRKLRVSRWFDDVEVGLILGEAAGASNGIVNQTDSRRQKSSLTA